MYRVIAVCAFVWTTALYSTALQAAEVGLITGAGGTHVKRFPDATTPDDLSFLAFPSFSGEARVAAGDFTGVSSKDILVGAGPGGLSHIKVFSGADNSLEQNFFAFDSSYTGGVFVAAGDIYGDGFDDIIVGTDAGVAGQIRVFDGNTGSLIVDFSPFTASFTGGVRVASGDVNNDGVEDIIAGAGPGAASHIKVFSGVGTEMQSFFAFDPSYTGGVYVASGDVNGNGHDDIIVGADAGSAGGHVRVFDGLTGAILQDFLAFPVSFTGGARVAAGDITGDGLADIIVGAGAGSGGGHVKVFDGATGDLLSSFFSYDPGYSDGIHVATFVPEPASALLLLFAAVPLAVTRSRR